MTGNAQGPAAAHADRTRVGCCGFAMAQARYYRHFDIVEVQQTFYQPPRFETLTRWREAAPPGFDFTLKAWQLITHPPSSPTYRRLRRPIPADRHPLYGAFQPTAEVWAAWQTTLHCAQALGARLVLFQTPASFIPQAPNIEHLRAFITGARSETGDIRLAWEPRGWPVGLAQDLCDELGLIRVVDPFRDPPPPRGCATSVCTAWAATATSTPMRSWSVCAGSVRARPGACSTTAAWPLTPSASSGCSRPEIGFRAAAGSHRRQALQR